MATEPTSQIGIQEPGKLNQTKANSMHSLKSFLPKSLMSTLAMPDQAPPPSQGPEAEPAVFPRHPHSETQCSEFVKRRIQEAALARWNNNSDEAQTDSPSKSQRVRANISAGSTRSSGSSPRSTRSKQSKSKSVEKMSVSLDAPSLQQRRTPRKTSSGQPTKKTRDSPTPSSESRPSSSRQTRPSKSRTNSRNRNKTVSKSNSTFLVQTVPPCLRVPPRRNNIMSQAA
jgi:hypothetical protein